MGAAAQAGQLRQVGENPLPLLAVGGLEVLPNLAPISRTFEASYDLDGPEASIPVYVRNRITLPTDLRENLAFLRGWQRIFDGDSFVYDYPLR